MHTQLFIATTNPGKLRDFRVAAAACVGQSFAGQFSIEPLAGLDSIPTPSETGATFAENACSKAIYYSRTAVGCIVLADDSGLEVDALRGAPGIRSARYAADAGFRPDLPADAANNLFLLENLQKVHNPDRGTRYRCVLAAAYNGKILTSAEGTVEGEILNAPRGTGGFGYDPFFYLPSVGCTMAELDLEAKLAISHRGHALRTLLVKLDETGHSTVNSRE